MSEQTQVKALNGVAIFMWIGFVLAMLVAVFTMPVETVFVVLFFIALFVGAGKLLGKRTE